MKLTNSLLFVVFTLIASASFAGAVADKVRQKDFTEAAKDNVTAMNKDCGTSITFSVEMNEYKDADWTGLAPNCSNAVSGVQNVCGESDGAYKDAVGKHIKKIKCFPTSGKAVAEVKGTTLEYHAPSSEPMGADKVQEIVKAAVDK